MTDTDTYTFDQLDDRAKNKARDKHRYDDVQDEWWDHVYEDAIRMGALMGIEVGTNKRRTMNDKTIDYPDISFSGFCSQGDGCCWSGSLNTWQFEGAVNRVDAEVGKGDDLLALAAQAEELHGAITAVEVANRLSPVDDRGDPDVDFPDCEIGIRIAVTGKERCFSTAVDSSILPEEIEAAATVFVANFADWIYNRLEAEHEYFTSDEYVDGRLRESDMTFDEDGNDE